MERSENFSPFAYRCEKMIKDDRSCPHANTFLLQATNDVHLVNVLLQIAGQHIQIVLSNGKAAVTKYLLERDHRASHGCPFLGEGVTETMDTRLL